MFQAFLKNYEFFFEFPNQIYIVLDIGKNTQMIKVHKDPFNISDHAITLKNINPFQILKIEVFLASLKFPLKKIGSNSVKLNKISDPLHSKKWTERVSIFDNKINIGNLTFEFRFGVDSGFKHPFIPERRSLQQGFAKTENMSLKNLHPGPSRRLLNKKPVTSLEQLSSLHSLNSQSETSPNVISNMSNISKISKKAVNFPMFPKNSRTSLSIIEEAAKHRPTIKEGLSNGFLKSNLE